MADKYANILYASMTESAANTLTFEEITIGLSIFDKVGILIHRLEWYRWATQIVATTDVVNWGLSASDQFATTSPGQSSILTYHTKEVRDFGVAGVHEIFTMPLVDDFSTLPGGGLLTTPKPLFMFTEGDNCGGANIIELRMFFTIIQLKAEEYFELLETRQFFG